MDEEHKATSVGRRSRHHRAAEQRAHVEGWRASGLTQRAYAAEHGLSQKSLGRWSQRLRCEEAARQHSIGASVFVPAEQPCAEVGSVRWHVPGDGGVVDGSAADVAGAIVGVLRALGRCP